MVALNNDGLLTFRKYRSIPYCPRHASFLSLGSSQPTQRKHEVIPAAAGAQSGYSCRAYEGGSLITVLLFVHILAAGTWLGTNIVQAVTNNRMAQQEAAVASAWLLATVRWGRIIYTPSAIVLLITGIWMVVISNGVYEFENVFVVIGVAMVILGAVLGMRVFGPTGEQASALRLQGEDATSLYTRLRTFGLIDSLALLLTIAAMVGRWGA